MPVDVSIYIPVRRLRIDTGENDRVPVRSEEASDLEERAPGSQSDTVVDTEKMPAKTHMIYSSSSFSFGHKPS